MRLRFAVHAAVLSLAMSVSTLSAEETWKAGCARAVITPDRPLWLAGYAHRTRPAEGKIHDLWLKALALEDPDGRRAVLVSSDHLGWSRVQYERIVGDLQERFGLDRSAVMLAASHTHSGPVLREALLDCYPLEDKPEQMAAIEEYSRRLEGIAVETVGKALAALAPARLSAGEGRAGFAVNRRNNREAEVARLRKEGIPLQGPVDHLVPVLAVHDLDGKLVAAAFGYACHNTDLDGYRWCGDYAGFAQIAVEERHPGAAALFWTGCGADQNPLPRRDLALCERYGRELAGAVEDVLSSPLRPLAPSLRTAGESVRLDFDGTIKREDLEMEAASGNAVYARWARRLLRALDAGKTFETSHPYAVQAWRLGDQTWIALAGEVVVDYAYRLRRDIGPRTWVCAYAGDVMGYIPSRRVWEEGGYEAGALHEYGQPALRWAGDMEERIAGAAVRLARAVSAPSWSVRRELYREHPRPGAAALAAQWASGPGLERLEVRGVEARDDVPSEQTVRFSADNGRTWSEPRALPDAMVRRSGVEVWEGSGAKLFDPVAGVLVEAWLRQVHRDGLYRNFTYARVSRDGGRAWSAPRQLRYEEGEKFDPADPLRPGFLLKNQAYFGSGFLRHSSGVLIHPVAHASAPGDAEDARRPWKMGSLCFTGRWDASAGEYRWTAGKRVSVSPEVSSRGLMEPDAAELEGGRVLVVWRCSDTPSTPGRKWFATSDDAGATLSEPRELAYDDGSRFYSPSSFHRLVRVKATGKLHWIGNVCEAPPRGNSPRHPLVIAEVDEGAPALRKGSLAVIDDRRPGQGPDVQLSNFSLLEDRETGGLELLLTHYGSEANVFSADCYRYTLRWR